LNRPSFITVPF